MGPRLSPASEPSTPAGRSSSEVLPGARPVLAPGDSGGGVDVGELSPGSAPALLQLLTVVLQALDAGTGGRERLCQGTATLLDCEEIAYACLRPPHLSVMLWSAGSGASGYSLDLGEGRNDGRAPSGRVSTLVTQDGDQGPGPSPATLRTVHGIPGWIATGAAGVRPDRVRSTHWAEVTLTQAEDRYAVLALGRPCPFGPEDVRRVSLVLPHLALLDHLVDRLDRSACTSSAVRLTEREQQVLMLLSSGQTARRMAQRLGISERTVQKHLGNLYTKLGTHDRLTTVERARSLSLLEPSVRLQR